MSLNDRLKKTRQELNDVSPSFCLAKWLQVTLHLQNGLTHSCHHPDTHVVPLDELKKNPSALHNTKYKKLQRKKMLEGERPSECQYCWNIEDLEKEHVSDRIIKSSDGWASPHLNKVSKLPWNKNVNPSYLEVSFSHQCNFKCTYCFPHVSSSWLNEIKKQGPYQLSYDYNSLQTLERINKLPIEGDYNPYVEAFWKWLPETYSDLKVLRVTGGEPLLSESTFQLLQYIHKNPHPSLDLSLNSNLGVPAHKIEKLIQYLRPIVDGGQVREFRLYTSLDTWGKQAEYIRTGLKLKLFRKNLRTLFKEIPGLKVTVMCTFSLLSVPSYRKFLKKFLKWKDAAAFYGGEITLDVSYLRHPEFLSVSLLPKKYQKVFQNILHFAANEKSPFGRGFNDYEVEKISRLVSYFNETKNSDAIKVHRNDFINYIHQLDQRRGTNFNDVFKTFAPLVKEWTYGELLKFFSQKKEIEITGG